MLASHRGLEIRQMRPVYLLILGLGLGYLTGTAGGRPVPATAEVTEEPRREALKAGSVINETVLREISATLKRIETRVEAIEKNTTPAGAAPVRAKGVPSNSKK